jgi:hypothetical protein
MLPHWLGRFGSCNDLLRMRAEANLIGKPATRAAQMPEKLQ